MKAKFDFQKLDVYQRALDFVALADDVISQLPRGHAHLADQLQRAATSVSLNIAEGAGEFSPREKGRLYRIARRSATESAAVLDLLHRKGLVEDSMIEDGQDALREVVRMLTRIVRNLQEGLKEVGGDREKG